MLFYFYSTAILFVAFSTVGAKHRNQLKMNVYYEPHDPESIRFFKQQLMPLAENGLMEHIKIKLVPTGRASCNPAHKEYECECKNGEKECEIMHLISCILHDYRNHTNALELISCIQEQPDFDQAYVKCVEKLPTRDAKWFAICPRKFRGNYLSWINTLRTKALGFKLPSVPTIIMNDQIIPSFELKVQVCNLLDRQQTQACQ